MVEPISGEDALRHVEENASKLASLSRKEKRKAAKKLKRRQVRKEVALNERAEEEARLNDPEEQLRIRLKEQEEEEILERERKAFEEREKLWFEAAKKAEEESQQRKLLEEEEELQRKQFEDKNDLNEDGAWEYVEEGPAEIIWHGDEITVKKKRVRVAKKNVGQQSQKEDIDRPTSNPLPPQSEAFADYKSSSMPSTHQVFESVAQQVPNFGTEQDKAHCPFQIKTGACRFGSRCSRVHFYPDKSCTLLIKNMYNGPGLAWEQDEGLEYTDEEVERCYEEFYEDVHTEFLKFGEIVNFKVCKNGSSHLRGNVYVHYKSLESAILAYHSINGRYFAGKQITCEFVGITRWKVAICGEYIKSKLKTCSRGMACNFIHCFRNPGGDYEWADSDNPPPRYWVKKMAALFGSRDESSRFDQETEREIRGHSKNSRKKLKAKCHSGRSRSSEMESFNAYTGGDNDGENTRWSSRSSRHAHYYVESIHDHHNDSGSDNFDRNRCIGPYRSHTRTSSSHLKTEKEFPDHHMKHAKYNPSDCERYEPLNRSQSEDSDAKYSDLLRVRDHRGHSRKERSSVAKPILHHESRESDVNYEAGDPVCPDKRRKSQNDDPEHYCRENVDEWHRWEPGSSSSDKCPKSRRRYSIENCEQYIGTTKSHVQNLGVHHRKSRSRSSSQSSFGTDSNGTDKATDSSDGYQEFKENHKLCHAIQLQHESNSKKNKFQKLQARDGSLSCQEFKGKSDCELEDSKLISYDAKAQTSCHIALEEYEDRIVSSEGHKCSQKHETTGKREGYKRKKGKYEKSTEMEDEVSTLALNNVNGNGASKKRSRSQSRVQRLGRSRTERSQLDES